jgi:response regulator receiver domain
MKSSDSIIVIIEDNKSLDHEPFIIECRDIYKDVLFFTEPENALQYIRDNLQERLIVLLDIAFPANSPDGHQVLESIRQYSYLIPVIIWTGKDEDREKFADLINNKSFAYIKKSASTEEILKVFAEADTQLNYDVASALSEWIETHTNDEKERPYIITMDGKQYSLNDILKACRCQDELGLIFTQKLLRLTIDLLMRNKERFND